MKFGRRIIEESRPDWANQYLNYKELKKAIKVITGAETSHFTISQVTSNFGNVPALAGNTYRPPESRFQDLLNFEVKKINCFASLQYSGLMTRLSALIRSLRRHDFVDLESVVAACDSAISDAADLHSYIHLNFLGFRKITKKYDKHNHSTSSFFYLAHLLKEPFFNLNMELLVLMVNLSFAELRKADPVPLPPESKERVTKYFVVPDHHSMSVRLKLAKYIPLSLHPAAILSLSSVLSMESGELMEKEKIDTEQFSALVATHGIGTPGVDAQGLCSNAAFYNSPDNRPAVGMAYLDTPELARYADFLKRSTEQFASSSQSFEFPNVHRLRWSCPVDLDQQSSTPVVLERVTGRGVADDPSEWVDIDYRESGMSSAHNSVCLNAGDFDRKPSATDLAKKAIAPSESIPAIIAFLETAMNGKPLSGKFLYWCHRTNYRGAIGFAHIDESIIFASTPALANISQIVCSPSTQRVTGCPNAVITVTLGDWSHPMAERLLRDLTACKEMVEISEYSPILHGIAVVHKNQESLPQWFNALQNFEADETKEDPKEEQRIDATKPKPVDRLLHDRSVAGCANPLAAVASLQTAFTVPAGTPLAAPLGDLSTASARVPLLQRHPHDTVDSADAAERPSLIRRVTLPWFQFVAWVKGDTGEARAAQAVRVEPKTFFANERTLLQWMNTAVLLSTIGITLLNFGTPTGRIAGLLMAPVAVFFLCYSFLVYLRRSYCLERKEPINYNDRLGPSILVLCLVGALSATIILNILSGNELRYIHPAESPPHHVVNSTGHVVNHARTQNPFPNQTEGNVLPDQTAEGTANSAGPVENRPATTQPSNFISGERPSPSPIPTSFLKVHST